MVFTHSTPNHSLFFILDVLYPTLRTISLPSLVQSPVVCSGRCKCHLYLFVRNTSRYYLSDDSKTNSASTIESPSDLPPDEEVSESDIQSDESEDDDADTDADVVSEEGGAVSGRR